MRQGGVHHWKGLEMERGGRSWRREGGIIGGVIGLKGGGGCGCREERGAQSSLPVTKPEFPLFQAV